MPFKLSRIFITSSFIPSIEEYSCKTPSILASTTADPGVEDNIILLSAFPKVWPKPLSRGSSIIFE